MTRFGRVRIKTTAGNTVRAPDAPITQADRWSGPFAFAFAAGGAAIGFNNIWQFPALVVQYGGGAFVAVYLLFVLVLGVPLLIAELLLGRAARAAPPQALRLLSPQRRYARVWSVAGGFAVVASFIVFSYLSVIAGWMLAYVVRAAVGVFTGQTADGMAALFTALVRDPEKQLFWHVAFVLACGAIVSRGLRQGLAPMTRVATPLALIVLLGLLAYAATLESLGTAVRHLLEPDFTKLTVEAVWVAAGQVFFSLGLGFGMMLMYGAYLKEDTSIPRAAGGVAAIDTVTALVGAAVVYAVLYAGGIEPASGPGLAFQALPLAFDHLPAGRWFAMFFFLFLSLVALLRAVALLETVTAWTIDRFHVSRTRAAIVVGSAAWLLGLVTVLSFNYWAFSFSVFGAEKRLGAFDLMQNVTTQLLLPLSALALAVFAGWTVRTDSSREALALRSPCAYDAWIWSLRVAVPLVLLVLSFYLPKLYS